MYICSECENIFSEEDLKYVSENVGECWGYPAYHRRRCCPFCEGEVESYTEVERG